MEDFIFIYDCAKTPFTMELDGNPEIRIKFE